MQYCTLHHLSSQVYDGQLSWIFQGKPSINTAQTITADTKPLADERKIHAKQNLRIQYSPRMTRVTG